VNGPHRRRFHRRRFHRRRFQRRRFQRRRFQSARVGSSPGAHAHKTHSADRPSRRDEPIRLCVSLKFSFQSGEGRLLVLERFAGRRRLLNAGLQWECRIPNRLGKRMRAKCFARAAGSTGPKVQTGTKPETSSKSQAPNLDQAPNHKHQISNKDQNANTKKINGDSVHQRR